MDRSEGRNAGKIGGPTASPIAPGRAAGGESREGSDGGDGGDDGGRQELLSYVRGTTRLACKSRRSYNLPSSLTYIYYIYYLLFYSIIPATPSPCCWT